MEEIIPNLRKDCAEMNFHGRNHPKTQKCSGRDEFPRKKSSLIAEMLWQGCFSIGKCIPVRRNCCSRMLLWLEKHPCKTKSKFQDAPAARRASAIRTTSGQNGQNGQSNQNNQRPERPEQSEQPEPSENPAQPVTA